MEARGVQNIDNSRENKIVRREVYSMLNAAAPGKWCCDYKPEIMLWKCLEEVLTSGTKVSYLSAGISGSGSRSHHPLVRHVLLLNLLLYKPLNRPDRPTCLDLSQYLVNVLFCL
jgi:hypothetical protein